MPMQEGLLRRLGSDMVSKAAGGPESTGSSVI